MPAYSVIHLAVAAGSSPVSMLAAVIGIVLFLGTLTSGLVTFLLRRRSTSGVVATSTADILWAQAQDMRQLLLQRLEATERQRDALIASHTEQVIPSLAAVSVSLNSVSGRLVEIIQRLDSLELTRAQDHE